MGLDWPWPGIAACQAMFFVGDHSVGSEEASTGEAPCPKNAGHTAGCLPGVPGASAQHKHKTKDQAGDMGDSWLGCFKSRTHDDACVQQFSGRRRSAANGLGYFFAAPFKRTASVTVTLPLRVVPATNSNC